MLSGISQCVIEKHRRKDRWKDGWEDRWTNGQAGGQVDKWIGGRIPGVRLEMGGRTGRQMERWEDDWG